ncbi:MAG: hypothetical protein M0P59_13490 [Gallionella sp.]|jgi:hypothetical protein|nr:hypothetical protein [Gallionella sp.]
MINLREEISTIQHCLIKDQADMYVALFKKFALEMVGENEEMLDMGVGNEDYWLEENDQRRDRNQLRAEQRLALEGDVK